MSIPVSAQNAPNASAAAVSAQVQAKQINPLLRTGKTTGEDHFSFKDVLDIINPLQHIPIINNIYRKITGDEISNVSRIAGDALYGGFVGAAFGMANAVAVNETGNDIGGVALTKMGLIKSQEDAQTASNGKSKSSSGLSDADLKNMPVVEVHPIAHANNDIPNEAEDLAPKKITWDQPVSLASAAPSAMPTPKDLNDIETGSNDIISEDKIAHTVIDPNEQPADAPVKQSADQSADPSVSKQDVQKNMLDGLDKYQALQKETNPGLIVPKIADPNTVTAEANTQATAQASAQAAAPKNIFATPAGAPTAANDADEAPKAPVQPTAEFRKLRHY